MKNLFILFSYTVLFSTLTACSVNPKVKSQLEQSIPLSVADEVLLLELYDSIPTTARLIGTVQVKDKVLTSNCSFETVVAFAKSEARKAGKHHQINRTQETF